MKIKFGDILFSLIIILLFVVMYVFSVLSSGLKNIQEKWPEYRCNPMMMPFASTFGPQGTDTTSNFSTCVQSQMTGLMGTLMEPVNYAMSLGNTISGGITTAIDDVRKLVSSLRDMITSIVTQIFGVFMNILIQVLHLIVKMKDLGSKVVGVMATCMYLISGMQKTGVSIWQGPLGDVVRFLCFHPETPLVLKNGRQKKMKKIKVGDVLKNGSKVLGILTLQGSEKNPYYRIFSNSLQDNIYVTGSHLVQHPTTGRFIPVSLLPEAQATTLYTKQMNCLITDDHLIPVGEYIFWDWEDGN